MNPVERGKEFVAHYGVKGQRWGVRNEDKSSGRSKGKTEKDLTPQEAKNLATSRKKFNAKFEESSGDSEKGWRPTKKQVAIGVGGAVIAGAIIYKVAKGPGAGGTAFSPEEYAKLARITEKPGYLAEMAGKPLPPAQYSGLVHQTSNRIWTGSYISPESFNQQAMSFPAGHQFFRVSAAVEQGFKPATYATSNADDLARYVAAHGVPTHIVSFKAATDVKVPDLYTNLEAMRHSMVKMGYSNITPEKVMEHYADRAGGGWSDPLSKQFFSTLKGQGFHAIIDDMDAGVYAEAPLVIFDPGSFSGKTSTPIKDIGRDVLLKNLTEIKNRR